MSNVVIQGFPNNGAYTPQDLTGLLYKSGIITSADIIAMFSSFVPYRLLPDINQPDVYYDVESVILEATGPVGFTLSGGQPGEPHWYLSTGLFDFGFDETFMQQSVYRYVAKCVVPGGRTSTNGNIIQTAKTFSIGSSSTFCAFYPSNCSYVSGDMQIAYKVAYKVRKFGELI